MVSNPPAATQLRVGAANIEDVLLRFEGDPVDRVTLEETVSDLLALADELDVNVGGITPEGLALGHRYVMGNVNAYCPKCSEEQGVCVLDCDYDLDKVESRKETR